MRCRSFLEIAVVLCYTAFSGPSVAQQARCEKEDWAFVLQNDTQEAVIDIYVGSTERLFRFYSSPIGGIIPMISFSDKSGDKSTISMQSGMPIYLESSKFQLIISRLDQQGPEVTARGSFGPCW